MTDKTQDITKLTFALSNFPRRLCCHHSHGSGPRREALPWCSCPRTRKRPGQSPVGGCTAGWRDPHSRPADTDCQLLCGLIFITFRSGTDLFFPHMNLHMSSLMRSHELSLLLKEVNMAPSDVRTCVCLGGFSHIDKQTGWCCFCISSNTFRSF